MKSFQHCVACGQPNERQKKRWYCFSCFQRASGVQLACQVLVRKAIMRGEIAPPKTLKCVDCGEPAFGYDHRDYDKPLAVEPICRSCNFYRGPAKPFSSYLPTGSMQPS